MAKKKKATNASIMDYRPAPSKKKRASAKRTSKKAMKGAANVLKGAVTGLAKKGRTVLKKDLKTFSKKSGTSTARGLSKETIKKLLSAPATQMYINKLIAAQMKKSQQGKTKTRQVKKATARDPGKLTGEDITRRRKGVAKDPGKLTGEDIARDLRSKTIEKTKAAVYRKRKARK
jgi:hypothetical protein